MIASGENHEPVHVLVADSNQTKSQLLTSALRRQPGIIVRSCGNELAHCLEAIRSGPVDVVVLSYNHSDPNQIDTLQGLHSSYPSVRLILSVDEYDRHLVVDALRAGVRGVFCCANHPFRALCRCITVVNNGEFWVSSQQLGIIVDALRVGVRHPIVNARNVGLLTPREEQVVNLVADGLGNREVAQQLDVTENTIKKSLLRIYDKLGVSNRVELVLYALTHQGITSSASNSAKSAETARKRPTSAEGVLRPGKD